MPLPKGFTYWVQNNTTNFLKMHLGKECLTKLTNYRNKNLYLFKSNDILILRKCKKINFFMLKEQI